MKFQVVFILVQLLCGLSRCETLINGSLTIAGLFQIKNSADGQCSEVETSSVKTVEAVKWVFRTLNDQDYIPGVTIGLCSPNNTPFYIISLKREEV